MSQSKIDLKEAITQIDLLIMSGSQGEARELLLKINLKKINRKFAESVADLARRLNMPALMVSVLRPIVRSHIELSAPPSSKEIILYATGLSRLGVFGEADKILKTQILKSSHEAQFALAQNEMLQWNYDSPVKRFEKYIQSGTTTEYENLVALVNIACCHIWSMRKEKGHEALKAIWRQVESQSARTNFRLIYAYSIELAAELAILTNDLKSAQELCNQANKLLQGTKSRYEFYSKKWAAILRVLKAETKNEVQHLHKIKEESLKLGDWETFRDCEFFEALATRNDELFRKVYLGTPYASYRKRIKILYKSQIKIPDGGYLWMPAQTTISGYSDQNYSALKVFDLASGKERNGGDSLVKQPLLMELMRLLAEDFYRPMPIGTLISKLYPDEFYNPDSSPQKAYQLVARLRKWFSQNLIPLDIEAKDNTFRVVSTNDSCGLLIPSSKVKSGRRYDSDVLNLKKNFGLDAFSTSQAAKILGKSERSTLRVLQLCLKQKRAIRLSDRKGARYKLK